MCEQSGGDATCHAEHGNSKAAQPVRTYLLDTVCSCIFSCKMAASRLRTRSLCSASALRSCFTCRHLTSSWRPRSHVHASAACVPQLIVTGFPGLLHGGFPLQRGQTMLASDRPAQTVQACRSKHGVALCCTASINCAAWHKKISRNQQRCVQ